MRHLVDEIQYFRSRISHNSPIKIYGEGAITNKVVRDYMASKMNVAYVENDGADEHLRSIISKKILLPTLWTLMQS